MPAIPYHRPHRCGCRRLEAPWHSHCIAVAKIQAGISVNLQVSSGGIIPDFPQQAMEINITKYICICIIKYLWWRLVISVCHLRTRINSYWVQAEIYHY